MTTKQFFHILSGDDLSIIRQCDKEIQNRFSLIGGLVACIITVSFVSITVAFIHFFDFWLFDIAIGLFFALMIANIYLLLLYTLSKNMLPYISSKGAKWTSISLRVLFIIVFAVIVSKPMELMFLSSILDKDIEEYRVQEFQAGEKVIESIYKQSIADLNRLKQWGDVTAEEKFKAKQKEKQNDLIALAQKINESNFYVQQLRILNSKYLFTWFFTLFMAALFLAPVYLKFFLAEHTDFYQIKKKIETQIILEEYASFKAAYKIFWKKYFTSLTEKPIDRRARMNIVHAEILQKNYEFEVDYIDPPFNTIRKKDSREFSEQDSLISQLYDV